MESSRVAAILCLSLQLANGFLFKSKVCYDKLGCFRNNNPFNNALGELPDSPTDINVRAFLWTQHNIDNAQEISAANLTTISSSYFDPNKQTTFLIHGYMSSKDTPIIYNMSRALLAKADLNVVGVDWSKGAKALYPKAVANTRVTGAVLANLITTMTTKFNLNLGRLHVIGHSLGAHVAGYLGKRVKGIHRITGLDPAGPMFTKTEPEVRLDPSDAQFVDAIHSDAGPLVDAGFGTLQQIGHVDYYPNGGTYQPGCPPPVKTTLEELVTGQFAAAFTSVSCSHDRAIWYYIESILNTNCEFTAYPCGSWKQFSAGKCTACGSSPCSVMGYNADEFAARGAYYLTTNPHSPFCKNK